MDFITVSGIVTLLLNETFSSLRYFLRAFSLEVILRLIVLFFFLVCCYFSSAKQVYNMVLLKRRKH